MIYTLTASPSLDLLMTLPATLESGGTYRADSEEIRPGGRGINISIMLKNLGFDSTALGFVAGFSGDELMQLTAEAGIKTGFIRVRKGRTRINLRFKDQDGEYTRINGLGPVVSDLDANYLIRRINDLKGGDFLILSGIIPPSMPQDMYKRCIEQVKNKEVSVIMDCPPELWRDALPHNPFLFKANLRDLRSYTGCAPDNPEEIIEAARDILKAGACNILVSLGSRGAVFVSKNSEPLHIKAPSSCIIDRVGAGDSMISGFVADYITTHDIKSAAMTAVAAGTATAGTKGLGSSVQVQSLKELIINEFENQPQDF